MSHIPDKMSRPGKVEESQSPWLPPGFRFHPTDEELVTYYLTGKVMNSTLSVQAITEVDLNKCEPWDLPAKAKMGEKEWYFFSLRDRKYPTGMRTNRATEAGYWKATGKDREVMNSRTNRLVGMKKTLVFYRGRAPKGEKTNWIMHEYRIEGEPQSSLIHSPKLSKDEWVVCRIFQKSAGGKKNPMECSNRSSSYNTDAQARSSLPALLESPNPNSVGEESDTCLLDGNFQSMDSMGGKSNSWQMKHELGDTLESLKGNGSGLFGYQSFLIDLYTSDLGAATTQGGGGGASVMKGMVGVGSGHGQKLARADTFNLQQQQQIQKYLEAQAHQRGGMNSSMRPCKAEPYAGEEDDAQSSQRSSLMESWGVGSESGGFGGGDGAEGGHGGVLPSLASESGVSELDNTNFLRGFTNRAVNPFADSSNPCADIVEGLWAY